MEDQQILPANVNLQSPESGETYLHEAVRREDVAEITNLLDLGADINIPDNEGRTPFSYAIEIGSSEIVEILLNYNPDFDNENVRENFYRNLLNFPNENLRIVKLILDHGFKVKNSDHPTPPILWAAVNSGLEELAISLVNLEEDRKVLTNIIEMWYISFSLHQQPFTPHQVETLEIVIKLKDLFLKDKEMYISKNHNCTLFILLLSEFDTELMNVCLDSGIDNIEESDIVAITKDVLLVCYDSNNPICDNEGRTGLHYAANVGNVGVILALLELHADINAKDIYGKTPLVYAYERIIEFSNDEVNDDIVNNQSHYDSDFYCRFSLLDLKIGAAQLMKQISKLISAGDFINLINLKTFRNMIIMMQKDTFISQYYVSIFSTIDQCEKEIEELKNEKLAELTYYDFLSKSSNQIAIYTKRKEVFESLQSDNILEKFELYGSLLQKKFYHAKFRIGLIERAEAMLFDILKWKHIPLVLVREILCNLNNDELYYFVTK